MICSRCVIYIDLSHENPWVPMTKPKFWYPHCSPITSGFHRYYVPMKSQWNPIKFLLSILESHGFTSKTKSSVQDEHSFASAKVEVMPREGLQTCDQHGRKCLAHLAIWPRTMDTHLGRDVGEILVSNHVNLWRSTFLQTYYDIPIVSKLQAQVEDMLTLEHGFMNYKELEEQQII